MLVDAFDRRIRYLRLSVTDRCDFRCVYCMAETMQFLPRADILSLEELYRVAAAFVRLGVTKIRITGGEPLVRNNIVSLCERISALPGLERLCMTSNGSRLVAMAAQLRQAGVQQLNISLDSLDPQRFRRLTRTGQLSDVLAGIDAALAVGFDRIKLNSVILNGDNDSDSVPLVAFARDKGIDIRFIEEMPLGHVGRDRQAAFLSSDALRDIIHAAIPLDSKPIEHDQSAGPARDWGIQGARSRVGFISPHSNNFCASCNRVRVTVEGRLLLCLGQEHSVDLRAILRAQPSSDAALEQAIIDAMRIKPERHEFAMDEPERIVRFMSTTGG